jgi:hypothetical protein
LASSAFFVVQLVEALVPAAAAAAAAFAATSVVADDADDASAFVDCNCRTAFFSIFIFACWSRTLRSSFASDEADDDDAATDDKAEGVCMFFFVFTRAAPDIAARLV